MGRQWLLTVKDNPKLEPAKPYLVGVQDIQLAGDKIKVTLRYRSPPQEGRQQEVLLSADVFPVSVTASLFLACGLDVSIGAGIRPRDALGKVVQVIFRPSAKDDIAVDHFEAVQSEG